MSFEHRHALSPLFDPSSVVVIAEEGTPPAWLDCIIESLGRSTCRTAVGRLPDARKGLEPGFDLAVIAVEEHSVGLALDSAISLGCRAAVLITDGADPAVVRRWRDTAKRAGLRLLGPRTMGFVRPSLALDASRMGPLPADGNVALVSQSGTLSSAILDWAAGGVIGFSLVVSLGAEIDVDLAQVLDFLANDPRTNSVVLYLEAVQRSRSFMSALRALATVKPVVVLKGHRDDASRRRALTHSGAICGSDAIYTAALRRAGAVQIRLFTQMFTAARILASHRWPIGKRISVISNGNGPAVLAEDMAKLNRIALPPLGEATKQALQARFPAVPVENPLDLGVEAGPRDFADAIVALAGDDCCDVVLVMFAPNAGVDGRAVTEAVIAAARDVRKQVYACWMGDSTVRPLWALLDAAGIPVFRTPEASVDAYATVATFHQNQMLLQQTPRALSSLDPPDLDGARMLIESVFSERRRVLTEMESKALLGAFHVPVTRTVIARSPTEAIVVAEQIGFPLAMKISSPEVIRKSDVGGVMLGVRNGAEVRTRFAEILAAVRRAQPEARIDGVTLQAMRGGSFGRELYVGVFRDPLFGPVIAFGAGGTRLEVVRDTTLEFPPLNRFLARRMIERTRVFEALGEFRGMPGIDFDALEELLVRVSSMVCELPWIAEMDINPVIADEQGVVAVDARVVIDPAAGQQSVRYAHMAILPYPDHLTQVRSSPDGYFYTIRAIRPEDADGLQRFVREMSDESRYFRFVSTLARLTPRMLVRYTQVDYDRELALVAVLGPGEGPGEGLGGGGGEGLVEGVRAGPREGSREGLQHPTRRDAPDGSSERVRDGRRARPAAVEGAEEAEEGKGERIIGVVRYLLNADGQSCEFAVAIADDWQGRRLGSTLMRAIVDAARAKGLRRIEGYVLANNSRMLGLMSSLGFGITTWREDPSMKLVSMELR